MDRKVEFADTRWIHSSLTHSPFTMDTIAFSGTLYSNSNVLASSTDPAAGLLEKCTPLFVMNKSPFRSVPSPASVLHG